MQHTPMMHDMDNTPAVNEFARVAVVLPQNTTFYTQQCFIAIAFDNVAGKATHEILGASTSRLPFLAGYEIFSRLCGDRAMRTVDGTLRINGEIVKPERYLELWRNTIQDAVTPEELPDRFGQTIHVRLHGKFEGLRGKRKMWTSSPFETFDDFQACYRDRMTDVDNGQGFYIEFDLRLPDATRDVYYLHSFLHSVDQNECLFFELRNADNSTLSRTAMSSTQSNLFARKDAA